MASLIQGKTASNLNRLNLGCGVRPLENWINVDTYKADGVDQVVNLNKSWPWNNESISEIHASHVLEHLDDCVHFMKEAQRVLSSGGFITIRVPHGWNRDAWADPTHKRPYFPESFLAFCAGYGTKNTFNLQYLNWNPRFKYVSCTISCKSWAKKLPFHKLYAHLLEKIFVDVISEIIIVLQKIK